jgi:hypothetical protein
MVFQDIRMQRSLQLVAVLCGSSVFLGMCSRRTKLGRDNRVFQVRKQAQLRRISHTEKRRRKTSTEKLTNCEI